MAKILILASNHGLWAEELQAPWDALTAAGHDLTLATFRGLTPLPLALSLDSEFIDPLLHTTINPPEVVARVRELLSSGAWDSPIKIDDAEMVNYEVLIIVGGPGAAIDLTGNPKVHKLLIEAWQKDKMIASLCYGVGALVWARKPDDYKKSIIEGKTIVAHPHEWDYDAMLGYTLDGATAENPSPDIITPGFIFPLRAIVEDAVGPTGRVISPPETTRATPVVHYDAPFLTALSVESSIAFGNKIVEVLGSAQA